MDLLRRLKEHHLEQYTHSKKTAQLCVLIGFKLGLKTQQLKDLEYIGLYHDIGKIKIDASILSNPGDLTEREYGIVKLHSLYSVSLIEAQSAQVREAILYHHENLDGTGYYGLIDKDLSIYQRIIHVADVYEALTAKRCYKEAWTKEDAYQYMIENSGTKFDQKIVKILKDIIF